MKEHRGLIIFFIAITLFALYMCNQVERENDRMNQIEERS